MTVLPLADFETGAILSLVFPLVTLLGVSLWLLVALRREPKGK